MEISIKYDTIDEGDINSLIEFYSKNKSETYNG